MRGRVLALSRINQEGTEAIEIFLQEIAKKEIKVEEITEKP